MNKWQSSLCVIAVVVAVIGGGFMGVIDASRKQAVWSRLKQLDERVMRLETERFGKKIWRDERWATSIDGISGRVMALEVGLDVAAGF